MNTLLQKTLNIRDDGCCSIHPDVLVLEEGAPCLRQCHLCSDEKMPLGNYATLLSSSFLLGAAAEPFLIANNNNNNTTDSSGDESKEQPSDHTGNNDDDQDDSILNERRQQQALLESILGRWLQVQSTTAAVSPSLSSSNTNHNHKNNNNSPRIPSDQIPIPAMSKHSRTTLMTAATTRLMLQDMRQLTTRVEQQQTTLEKQHELILELQKSLQEQSQTTQELCRTILQHVASNNNNNNNNITNDGDNNTQVKSVGQKDPVSSNTAGAVYHSIPKPKNNDNNNGQVGISRRLTPSKTPTTRSVPSQRSRRKVPRRATSQRSVDSSIRQPLTRHDSNCSFSLAATNNSSNNNNNNHVVTPSSNNNRRQGQGQGHSGNGRVELSLQHLQSRSSTEIALDGSHHSFERHAMPDLDAIFEDGCGDDLATIQRKKFNLPANLAMEIILESHRQNSNRENHDNEETEQQQEQKQQQQQQQQQDNNSHSNREISIASVNDILADSSADAAVVGDDVMDFPTSPDDVFDIRSSNQEMNPAPEVHNNNAATNKVDPKWGHSSMVEFATQDKVDVNLGVTGHMSLLELNVRDQDDHSDLSESQYMDMTNIDDDEEDDEADNMQHEDDNGQDYDESQLKQVSGLIIVDMYGDRGTYTGTVGPAKDPNGFGTMKYDSGRFYKGEWRKGRWFGHGTLLNANGDSYQGDFVGDARHGKGVYRFTSGDVYEGDFFEDNRHGFGKFKFYNGSVYEGDFCMGSFEGFGKYTFDGGYYEGDWKRDEYYGQGRLQYKDGSNYQGRFKRGSAHGYGEERLADGSVRSGLWRRGEFIQECTEAECIKLEKRGIKTKNPRFIGKSVNL